MRAFVQRAVIFSIFLSISVINAQDKYFGWQSPSANPGDYVEQKDMKEILTNAYKLYRENKDKDIPFGAMTLTHDEQAMRDDLVCIECPRVTLLSKQVNDVLKVMAKDPKLSGTDIVEEIGSMEAMYNIVMTTDQNTRGVRCERRELNFYELASRDNIFDDQSSVLILTKNFDARHISSIQLRRPGQKNIYYYRGKGKDRDKVVRVVIDDKNQAKVDYFVVRDNPQDIFRDKKLVEDHKSFVPPKADPAKEKKCEEEKKKRIYGMYTSYDSQTDPCAKEEDRLKVNYGVGVETNNAYLPKRVVLLEAEGKTVLAPGIKGTMKTEVSTKKREVEVGLTDDKNEKIVTAKANDAGRVEVGVPYKFNVYATNLDINGQVVVGNEGDTKTNFVLNYDKTPVASVEVGTDPKRDFASIGHTRKVGEGNFSIKYEVSKPAGTDFNSPHGVQQGVWARYSLSF